MKILIIKGKLSEVIILLLMSLKLMKMIQKKMQKTLKIPKNYSCDCYIIFIVFFLFGCDIINGLDVNPYYIFLPFTGNLWVTDFNSI